MHAKSILLGALGYALITFPLAYCWHLVVFKATYERLGYFSREEPIVVFGLLAILLQGVLLAVVYPRLCSGLTMAAGVTRFVLVMGLYHWTTHVLAEAAKHAIAPLATWFALESGYLLIQFTLGGLLLAAVYRRAGAAAAAE